MADDTLCFLAVDVDRRHRFIDWRDSRRHDDGGGHHGQDKRSNLYGMPPENPQEMREGYVRIGRFRFQTVPERKRSEVAAQLDTTISG